LTDNSDHIEALKRVKELLRLIPNHGIGYGLLRYMSGKDQIARALAALPQSEVNFLYLGQLDQVFDDRAPFRAARESVGASRSARGNRHYLFEISGMITDGRLRISWVYSENAHRRETVEKLADNFILALQAIIEHCQSPGAGGYTPSDFPMAKLDEKRLVGLLQRVEFDLD
jgi:non-ribosomal peptide synthase protein (TIGR01720 family)